MTPSEPSRYVTATFGWLFAVRWRAFELEDLLAVRKRIGEVRRILGRPVIYLSLIPEGPRTFTVEERTALVDFLRDLLARDCSSIHHVIDGTGFAASTRRSIVTNMAIAAADPGRFRTYATLEEALGEISAELNRPPAELIDDARARGLAFRR
jgi:hypothetical protein